MDYYVTLFDSHYLARGLAMYESLNEHYLKPYMLIIIAMDDECYRVLNSFNLANVDIVSLSDFEDDELLKVKETRPTGEYCWTSTPKSILYVFQKYNCTMCTYIDADLLFYSCPSVIIDELGEAENVIITEHRYSPEYDLTDTSGKYCVQFMTFKNNVKSIAILEWWKDRCLENCTLDKDKGICGDQKYLDDWMTRFDGIHEMQNLGAGIATWNVQQYSFCRKEKNIFYKYKSDDNYTPVIFYHFHALELFDKDVVRLTGAGYKIPDTAISFVYKEYIRCLDMICNKFKLWNNKECFRYEKHFRDSIDCLVHGNNLYNYSLFL